MHHDQQNHSGMSWASARRDARTRGGLPGWPLLAVLAATAVAAALRATGVIATDWRYVLLPLWIAPAVAVGLGAVAMIGLAILALAAKAVDWLSPAGAAEDEP